MLTKGDTALEAFGLSDGTEVQVLGSAVGGEKERVEQIPRNREIDNGASGHLPGLESRLTDGNVSHRHILPQADPMCPL